jgi:predicted N-formylglutamate amidohydrolase
MNDAVLITAQDGPPVEFAHETGQAPVLLTCDHASRAVPQALGNLGLADDLLARHIGWDIGAAVVTRRLARRLDAPAVLCGYSRLVIDCNRYLNDPTSVVGISDGVAVPGNAALSADARLARQVSIFAPYHAAIATRIGALRGTGVAPALISIHSFTPKMNNFERPWHIGVLWDGDGRIALPLLDALRAEPRLVVGDNEPYTGRDPTGYTQRHHALDQGLPHVEVELRQDLIADAAGAAEWADRLARVLVPILALPDLYLAIEPPPPHS